MCGDAAQFGITCTNISDPAVIKTTPDDIAAICANNQAANYMCEDNATKTNVEICGGGMHMGPDCKDANQAPISFEIACTMKESGATCTDSFGGPINLTQNCGNSQPTQIICLDNSIQPFPPPMDPMAACTNRGTNPSIACYDMRFSIEGAVIPYLDDFCTVTAQGTNLAAYLYSTEVTETVCKDGTGAITALANACLPANQATATCTDSYGNILTLSQICKTGPTCMTGGIASDFEMACTMQTMSTCTDPSGATMVLSQVCPGSGQQGPQCTTTTAGIVSATTFEMACTMKDTSTCMDSFGAPMILSQVCPGGQMGQTCKNIATQTIIDQQMACANPGTSECRDGMNNLLPLNTICQGGGGQPAGAWGCWASGGAKTDATFKPFPLACAEQGSTVCTDNTGADVTARLATYCGNAAQNSALTPPIVPIMCMQQGSMPMPLGPDLACNNQATSTCIDTRFMMQTQTPGMPAMPPMGTPISLAAFCPLTNNGDMPISYLLSIGNPNPASPKLRSVARRAARKTATPGMDGSYIFSCTLPANDAASVVFYGESTIYPGDNSVPPALVCYDNCPDIVDGGLTMHYAEYTGTTPTPSSYTFDKVAMMLKASLSGTSIVTTGGEDMYQWGFVSGPLFDGTNQNNMDALKCDWDPNQVCAWQAWSKLPEFYTWETGPNSWNQFTTLKDSKGNFVRLKPPLQVTYDKPDGGTYYLDYSGFGNLFGIPGKCVSLYTGEEAECGPETKYIPEFMINAGETVTDAKDANKLYLVKPLEVSQMMKASNPDDSSDVSACTGAGLTLTGLDLPDGADLPGPGADMATEPKVTTSPAVIGGVVQQ